MSRANVSASVLATPSTWESDVLDVRVGTLIVDISHSIDDIRERNKSEFDVVFVSCGWWYDPPSDVIAIDHLYDMEIRSTGEKLGTSCVSTISFPSKAHVEIAREALHDSRFLADPRLAQKSPDRYVRWLTEHQVYVPVEAPDGAFLVATDDLDGSRRISLIAVAKEFRGHGMGARLVAGVFSAEPTRVVWRVKVAAKNYRAIRFYEGLGFRVKSVSTVFHVWMKND